jgi:hypothetical protein
VRIQALGLGKTDRAAERAGILPPPTRETIERRLAELQRHVWSSYPAYAGYAPAPEWLTREALQQRVARKPAEAPAAYRRWIEDYLRQGLEEGWQSRLAQAIAIGGTAFVNQLRKKLSGATGARTNARAWRRLLPFRDVVKAVERVPGSSWEEFVEKRGDWGRDRALYVARMHGGQALGL